MRLITLSDGSQTKVDDVDFVYLSGFRWTKNNNGYAWRNPRGVHMLMHIEIAKRHEKVGFRIDHEDRDKLNNQNFNLRVATQSQNVANQRFHSRNTSGHRGVHFHKAANTYIAQITVRQVRLHLGSFASFQDACDAYDAAAECYFGAFKGQAQ